MCWEPVAFDWQAHKEAIEAFTIYSSEFNKLSSIRYLASTAQAPNCIRAHEAGTITHVYTNLYKLQLDIIETTYKHECTVSKEYTLLGETVQY